MAQDIATTAPTDADAVSVPGADISKIIDNWVDRAERWLWKGPRQAMLADDYQEFLKALKKTL